MTDTGDRQSENGFVIPEPTATELLTRFDRVTLPMLGGFGKYQKQLIVLTWIPALFIGFSQFSDSFLLARPNITCAEPGALQDLLGADRNSSALEESAQCRCNESTVELQTGLEENVVTKWCLVNDSEWQVHIAKFSLLVGSIFGYLVFGILADWFGRHRVLIISVLFMLVFGLTVAFSVNVPMFSTLRFFEGFCLAGITLSLYVLRTELCMPEWRFTMTMVAIFVVLAGQLLMPGVAYLCRDWQVLQAAIICPLLLMLSYIWIFPESLRWLLATQQYHRAKWMIERILKKNKLSVEPDVQSLLTELEKCLQMKPRKTCIVKVAGTRNLWKNIVVLCVNSLTGCGIHHCFARSMVNPEDVETTMFNNFYTDYYIKAGIAVASCVVLGPAVSLMGRRGGLLMLMIITALASLLQLGLMTLLGKYSKHLNITQAYDTLNRNFSVAFSVIGMFSSHAGSTLSIFLCAEITPTVIRGGGVGLVHASAGFGMLTAPIMDLHNQKGYFLHHIIFACCTLICIICILLLPETRNEPLTETIADGENYTRQLSLIPRRLGESHHLLHQPENNRDYSRVHETPLQEAANASAIELTVVATGDLSVSNNLKEGPDQPEPLDSSSHSSPFSSQAPGMAPGKDDIIQNKEERPLSSFSLHKAPRVTDPLLSDAEEHLEVQQSADRLKGSTKLSINDMGPSPKSEDGSGNAASHDSLPTIMPQTRPASLSICTTPVIEPCPSFTQESPNPLYNEMTDLPVFVESPGVLEDVTESTHDSLSSSAIPSPVAVSDLDPPSKPPPSVTPQSDIPIQLEEVEQSPYNRPHLDLDFSDVKDSSSHSSTPPNLHTHSLPTDSDHTPIAHLSSDNTTARGPTVLPVTDIVNTSTQESTTNIVQDSDISLHLDSVQSNSTVDLGAAETAPVTLMNSTVSSPIDCGILPTMDSEAFSTEENTFDSAT